MTYLVRMVVRSPEGVTRQVKTNFAGCADEGDARIKARAIYHVVVFKSVDPVEAET